MDIENKEPIKSYNEILEKDANVVEIHTEGEENANIPTQKPIDFIKNCYCIQCPFCQQQSTTRLVKKPSKCLYLSFILLCFLPPLCLIPLFTDSFYHKLHFCTSCGRQIGLHKSFSKPNTHFPFTTHN